MWGFFYYGILIFHSNISLPGTEILCGSNWATYKESDYLRTIDSNNNNEFSVLLFLCIFSVSTNSRCLMVSLKMTFP